MELSPGYKHSDVGVIPNDWDVKPLGEIGESLIGLTYRPSQVRTYGTLVLRSSNVQNGALCFEDNVFVEADVPERIMVKSGDILVCVRNGSRDLIGKSALIDERAIGMTFGAFMGVFRSKHGKLLHHVFQSSIFKKQINEHLGATINQITNKSLNSFKVPLPPTSAERTQIANALSEVDALVAGLDLLIVKKRDVKQAAMQQLLTGKTRLSGFSDTWNEIRLGQVLTICHGKNQRDVEVIDGAYPILATGGQIGTARRPLYDKPSVLIGRKGTINQPQYMEKPFWTVDTLFYSVIHGENSAKFLYYRFCLIDWLQYNEASGVPSLNARTIENIEIACPEPAEQFAIAVILSDMDAELSALATRRDKICNIKQAMMQELLTGRTRLNAKEETHV
jgi:type I restriction enzyme S subunit